MSESAGVMCAMAAAHPHIYLRTQGRGAMEIPMHEVAFDMQGHMDVVPKQSAFIDIGEVQASPDYATAVPHLGLRLGLLKWVVKVVTDVPQDQVRLVGRVFTSENNASHCVTDDKQRSLALRLWQFSLHSQSL